MMVAFNSFVITLYTVDHQTTSAYCLFLISLYFCFLFCLLYILVCRCIFSFDATLSHN